MRQQIQITTTSLGYRSICFDYIPLATFTHVLERYYPLKVNLDGRKLVYFEITGTYKTFRIDTILNAIKSELNFEITNAGNVITLSGKDYSKLTIT